jgi:hypothetical protein
MIKRYIQYFLLIFTITFPAGLLGSAFEIFALGRPVQTASAAALGRGGIGLAYADSISINFSNPAHLSAVYYAGLEMGLRGSYVRNGNNTLIEAREDFDFGVMKLPVTAKGGMAFGAYPLYKATADYAIANPEMNGSIRNYGQLYAMFIGGGYRFFPFLSAGISFEAISGKYEFETIIDYADSSLLDSRLLRNNGFDGRRIQGGLALSPMKNLQIGLAYSTMLSGSRQEISSYGAADGALSFLYGKPDTSGNISGSFIPNTLGAGISFQTSKLGIFSVDYQLMQFSDIAEDLDFAVFQNGSLGNMHRIAAGWEKPGSRQLFTPYLRKISWRAGFIFENGFIENQDKQHQMTAVSIGCGLPLSKFQHRIDVALLGGISQGQLYENITETEQWLQLKLSITAMERWFMTKGKYR